MHPNRRLSQAGLLAVKTDLGREYLDPGRSRAFEWSSDVPVDFNIHFHKGSEVTYPMKADGQKKGRGRFTAATGEDYCWMWSSQDAAKVTGKLGAEE